MDEVASAIRRGLLWLERDQERDGHWSDSEGLSRLSATAHAVRAFVACGFESDHHVVRRAVAWLMRPELAAGTSHYFWRLGPLSELYRSGVPESLIEHDLRVLRTAIEDGVRLDRRLNYPAFLLDCLANLDQGADRDEGHVDQLRELLAMEEVDITPGIWAYVALERVGAVEGVSLDLEKVARSLRESNGCYHLNGSVAETSYFILNCARSDVLSADPELSPIIDGAARWLISRQITRTGSWPTEQPLYNGSPQAPAYYTALACRALSAYLQRYRPRSLAQTALPDWSFRRRVTTITRYASATILCCITMTAAGLFLPSGGAARLITTSGIMGTMGTALSAIAFFWEARDRFGRHGHR
ncbi:hypothetical protein SM611_13210 [Actinomadura sp. DLS-62]|uniref:Terpene cyclase/mutase family protein n=2 Tax=Actinomadura monticuli TaxID=3097367 RepID=A0ABV4QD28_9ACTN